MSFFASIQIEINSFDIPIRSLFLASFVTIYLGMFEGWFILRSERPEDEIANQRIKEAITNILKYMPMVVFLLFPFQKFQIIYFVFFLGGHMYAWSFWRKYQKYPQKYSKELAKKRGILGVTTLVALILDKWFLLNIIDILDKFLNLEYLAGIANLNIILSFIQILFMIYDVLKKDELKTLDRKKDLKEFLIDITKNNRIAVYAVISIIILFIYPIFDGLESVRRLLAIIGCLVFILYEFFCVPKEIVDENQQIGEV